MAVGNKEIERRMGFHPANDKTGPAHDEVRKGAIALAKKWDKLLPDGREKSLAFTELESALQRANQAVACGPDGAEPAKQGTAKTAEAQKERKP